MPGGNTTVNNNNNNPAVIASGVHGNVPFVRMQIARDGKPVTIHPDKAEAFVNELLDAIAKARQAMTARLPGVTSCRDCQMLVTEAAAGVQDGRCYECHLLHDARMIDNPAMREYMALTGHPDTCAYWDAEASREEELEGACDCGLIARLDAEEARQADEPNDGTQYDEAAQLADALPVTPELDSYTTTDPITGSGETARQRRKRENREAWARRANDAGEGLLDSANN